MKYRIENHLGRLELHDSTIVQIQRGEGDIAIKLDWAKLADFKEIDIEEGLIIGQSELILKGVSQEKLRFDSGDVEVDQMKPAKELLNKLLIGTNEFIKEENQQMIIEGGVSVGKEYYWMKWDVHFSSFLFQWNNHITYTEWQNGKIPN
jgi:hypothetical protein